MVDVFNKIDKALLDAMATNKKTFTEAKFGYRVKDEEAMVNNVRQFHEWCEDIFNQGHRASEDVLQKRESELARETPAKRGEKISEEDLFQEEEKATNEQVSKLADRLKKLLDDRLKLKSRFPNGRERLFSTIDKTAARVGDAVHKFKAFCRELLEDANSGKLEANLSEDEPQGRSRPNKAPRKKDPQAGEKAKKRAEKLKSDLLAFFDQKLGRGELDNYPLFKADLLETIDEAAKVAEKTGTVQPFNGWCTTVLDELGKVAKETAKKGEKSPLQKWLERREAFLKKEQEPTVKHELPKFKRLNDVRLKDLRDLADQAWDEQMRAELETLYNAAEQTSFDAYYYNVAQRLFERRYEKQNRTPRTTPAPKTLHECKTIDDLGAYWRDKYNPRTRIDPNLSKADFTAVKEFLAGVEKVIAAFPKLKDRILNVVARDNGANTYATASTHMFTQNISLNLNPQLFKDREALLKTLAEDVKAHWHPGKGTIEEAGVHEAAHLVSQMLLVRAGYILPFQFGRTDAYEYNAKQLVEWASELLSKKGRPLKGTELTAAREGISGYAKKVVKWSETISEAAIDIATFGEKAKPLSRAIMQRLNEAFEGDTWRNRTVLQFIDVNRFWQRAMRTATVAKWYERRAAEGFPAGQQKTREDATSMIADKPLRDKLEAVVGSRAVWEKYLERHTPNEKVLESGKWSDEAINELAKDSMVEFFIKQVGGTITDGKVTLDEKGKNWLVDHVEEILDPTARYSREGNVNYDTSNIVDPKALTSSQKLWQDFSDALGVKTVFFNNPNGHFHGVFKDGITFLNVNSKKGLGDVFWHESFHWLKANNPKLYAKLVEAAGITQAQRKAFLERTGRTDLTTNEEIDEEILADQMSDVAKRTGLMQSLAGKNRGVVERVVQWLKDTMNKFIETFRNPTGRLTTAQAQALAGEFGKIARQLKDADGNQIFRVNNRTGDIEVIGGSKPPNVSREQIQAAAQSPAAKYSIDPNDNSTQSWGRRIQNLATSLTRSKPESKPYNQAITDALSKLTRHKIYYNYNGEKEGNVIVDSIQKVILARHAYRWEELLPVAGKQIAENLGLATTPEMSNYIADWMATGAINNTSPEATAFQKAMSNNPVEAKLLQEVRDTFKTVSNMTAEEKYEASIARNKHSDTLWGWVVEKGKGLKDWLGQSISKENLTDDLHPLLQLENRMLELATPAQAETIKKYFHPYMNARLSRGKAAIADMMIGDRERKMSKEDVQNIRDVLSQIYPNVDFSDFTPLASIVQSVDGDFAGLERFALAKLDKEMYEKLREVDAKGNPKYAPDAFTPSQSEADADAVIKAGEKKFGKAQEALVHYSNTLAAIQYTSGLITAHQFYSMVGGWQNYVPTERIFDEDEPYTVGKADSQKHKTGSKRRTLSPLQKIAANTEVFLQQAERNKVKLEVAEMVRLGGFGEILAETSKGDNRGKTIHFRENGKMKYIATPDESIVRALESIQTSSDANVVMQALKTMGSFMRAFYTGRNPEFILGNMWRDLQDAYIHNKFAIGKNPFPVLIDIWSNAVSGFLQSAGVKTKTKDYREFLAYGGTQSGFLTETADTTGRKIEQLGLGSRGEEYRKSPYRAMRQLWRGFCAVAEATENATRYSTFKHSKAELAKQHGGTASILDKKLAALAARDASVDFAKAGSTMRPINRVLLFSNAAVQSIALWGNTIEKAFKSSEGRKELAGKVFKLAMMAVAPALLQFAGNYSDDDRRKRYNALHDWQKNTYWVLGTDIFGQSIRIPKGMDMGIKIFSALTEEFLAHVAGDKPDSAKRIWKTFKDTLPSITTTIFTPAVETYMNYSIFKDAPIVPYGEQDDPKYKQYGIHTSPFSKFLGRAFNQSPRQLDHLIAGYGGALGTYISLGSDGVYGLRKFFFDPYKNPRVVQDYYEALDKQQELLDTYKQRRQDGEKVELPEEYDRALHARLKGVQEQMRKISKAEKKLVDNPKLSDREKEEKLRELEKKRVALCERVLNRAR